VADGLIVSTATAARLMRLRRAGRFCPHAQEHSAHSDSAALSMDRAIVLDQGAMVDMRIVTDHQAILTVDGQFEFALMDGDHITVKASPPSRALSAFIRRRIFIAR